MDAAAVSIILPCFNEEKAVAETVASIQRCLARAGRYEIVIVNDGSTDGTAALLQGIAADKPHIKLLNHTTNKGYGAALKTGIRKASGELIAIIDADGTYPVERLPELIQIAGTKDMVVGARTAQDAAPSLMRKITKMCLNKYCSWLTGERIPDFNSGLRVFRRSVAEKFLGILPDGFSFTATITIAMLTNHYEVCFVPIQYSKRIGKSKIRPLQDTLNFLQLILRTGVYFAPLRVFLPITGLFGLLFSASLCFDIFILADLTEKTMLLLILTLNTALFALLADMIDKRTER